MSIDLFGVAPAQPNPVRLKRQRAAQARGYSSAPGTGPEGETCKSCGHLVRKRLASTYLKCGLMRAIWTGGAGTDVRASSPACRNWKAGGSP